MKTLLIAVLLLFSASAHAETMTCMEIANSGGSTACYDSKGKETFYHYPNSRSSQSYSTPYETKKKERTPFRPFRILPEVPGSYKYPLSDY